MVNALGQVDCCVNSIVGEQGAVVASSDDHQGHSDKMAMGLGGHGDHAQDPQSSDPASPHSDHDAGSCDCKDGMCGQSLVALAQTADAAVFAHVTDETWARGLPAQSGHQSARQFQIRAPPVLL